MNDKKLESSRKKKQWLLAIAAILALLVLSAVAVTLSEPSKTNDMQAANNPDDMQPHSIATPGSSVSDSDIWITKSESSIQNMAREVRDLKQQLNTLKAENIERSKEESKRASMIPDATLPPAPINAPAFIPNMGPESLNNGVNPVIRAPVFQSTQPPSNGVRESQVSPPNNMNKPKPQGVLLVRMSRPMHAGNKSSPKELKQTWLGIGFTEARLLNGLDAATGGQAQKNPQPVLLEVTNVTTLANHFKDDYKACFITAGGYGDISSERAYLRLEKLSCIGDNGQTIEENIDGYITGPDGKVGVRGRLVSKQGLVLAKALLAGIASGIGDAFTQTNSTQTISPLGATTTIKPNKALQAGMYNGVGSAMNKLADFYIQQANKLYPVIEIDAGQTVDVIIKNGTSIPQWRGEH